MTGMTGGNPIFPILSHRGIKKSNVINSFVLLKNHSYYKKNFECTAQKGKKGKVLCSPGRDTHNTKTDIEIKIVVGIAEAKS